MTTKTRNIIIGALVALALLLIAGGALATEREKIPAPYSSSSATATSGAPVATANGYGYGGSAVGSTGDSAFYVLPAPIGGSNLPAGMCQRSKYSHRAFVWNFVSLADGDSHTDLECLRLLIELERLRATPTPKPVVEILTAPPPSYSLSTSATACEPPAKAKTVSAAKKAGACR